VGETAKISGEDTSYSMETKVVDLPGVTEDNTKFYVAFNQQLTVNNGQEILADSNINMGTTGLDFIPNDAYVGSGYVSANGKLTMYLDGTPTGGAVYVYVIQFIDGNSILNYATSLPAGTITL
jgi:hypothetical protein